MSATFEFTIESTSLWRSISDEGSEEIDAAHLEHWKAASSLLRRRTFNYGGATVSLEVDWRPLVRRYQRDYRLMQELHKVIGTPAMHEASRKLHAGPKGVKVPASLTVESRGKSKNRESNYKSIVESFLYDVFLIMNIASPGACNFYSTVLRSKNDRFPAEISLSEFYFDLALINGREGKWPPPKMLPLDTVSTWFFAVRSGVSQIPQNRMEKVLFALLHISKMGISPTIVIWLFYALETLFDTKAGENFRVLTERIQLLLSPNEKQMKILRKNLRAMYDLRSSFVHGGLEIAHPMHNETLDRDVDENYARISNVSEFGFGLVLSAVQAVIEKDWRWPQFKEVLCGTPLRADDRFEVTKRRAKA